MANMVHLMHHSTGISNGNSGKMVHLMHHFRYSDAENPEEWCT